MEFVNWQNDIRDLNSPKLIDDFRNMISTSSSMYQFLIEAYDNAFNEGLINADYYKR